MNVEKLKTHDMEKEDGDYFISFRLLQGENKLPLRKFKNAPIINLWVKVIKCISKLTQCLQRFQKNHTKFSWQFIFKWLWEP